MILLLLLNTLVTATFNDTIIDGIVIYYNIGKEWNAQEGDTLFFTTKIPMLDKEEYRIRITGDARQLKIMGRRIEKYPANEWFIGIDNTNGNKHICRWWNPDYYELQIAFIAQSTGLRQLNVFFEKWRF